MSVERAYLVRLPGSDPQVASLSKDIESARRRAAKALPGDRTDVMRFEAMMTQLERLASLRLRRSDAQVVALPSPAGQSGLGVLTAPEQLDSASPVVADAVTSWLVAGDVAIEVRDPFGVGPTERDDAAMNGIAPPARPWHAPNGERGRRAVAQRFQEQVERAANQETDAAIVPSGVSNSILTETLRRFVGTGGQYIEAPVRYRDGSGAEPFPLRCLTFAPALPELPRVLRFALLSIRHTEMDVEVDGAWLRNTGISRRRPAGETDQLVYEISRRQLAELTASGPLLIELYQTGLDTAVVGFYRAVVRQLLAAPGSVAVVPMYFRSMPPEHVSHEVAGHRQQTHFVRGSAWAI